MAARRPQVLLFDAVGTLLAPDPPFAEVYARVGREYGAHLDAAEVTRRFPDALAEARREVDGMASDAVEAVDRFHRPPTCEEREWQRWRAIVGHIFCEFPAARDGLFFALWEHFARSENWLLFDDAVELLPRLAGAGLTLGIASNFDRRLAPLCRAHRPLRALGRVFTSAALGHPKPCPNFFAAIERELAIDGSEILLVGDDVENDYHGPRAAGWQALLIDRDNRHSEVEERIESLTEIAARLGLA